MAICFTIFLIIFIDQCGKCGGRNDTCRLIQGSFNESARVQGYRTVIKIPAGSSNLDIRQYGIYGARDDNYLGMMRGYCKTFKGLITYK